jgi:hypothetical protein
MFFRCAGVSVRRLGERRKARGVNHKRDTCRSVKTEVRWFRTSEGLLALPEGKPWPSGSGARPAALSGVRRFSGEILARRFKLYRTGRQFGGGGAPAAYQVDPPLCLLVIGYLVFSYIMYLSSSWAASYDDSIEPDPIIVLLQWRSWRFFFGFPFQFSSLYFALLASLSTVLDFQRFITSQITCSKSS